MKSLKILIPILLLSIFAISCSSDDSSTKVKYQITGLDVSINNIKYRNGSGAIVEITNPNNFGSGSDSRTIFVSDFPFDASLEITVNNTTPSPKVYDLAIYVDGDQVATSSLSVPATSVSTGNVDFVIEP